MPAPAAGPPLSVLWSHLLWTSYRAHSWIIRAPLKQHRFSKNTTKHHTHPLFLPAGCNAENDFKNPTCHPRKDVTAYVFSQPTWEHIIHFPRTRNWSTNPDVMIALGWQIWHCSIFEYFTLFAANVSLCKMGFLLRSFKVHQVSVTWHCQELNLTAVFLRL